MLMVIMVGTYGRGRCRWTRVCLNSAGVRAEIGGDLLCMYLFTACTYMEIVAMKK